MLELSWNDLTVDFHHLNREKLVQEWQWLISDTMLPIMISSIGDLFLEDVDEAIYWLNIGTAELQKIADSAEEFQEKLKDKTLLNEWFIVALVADLKASGKELTRGMVYGFKQLPILGGTYEVENFELTDIEVNCSLAGQIHYQIKDLPDGTKVHFSIKN
jgi:hypothetical protein